MSIFQIILIAGILLLIIIYFTQLRSRLFDRILFVFLFAVGLVFIFLPDLTTKIAHVLGIGRGADFLFYLFIILAFYAFILLYSKLRKFENTLTEIIRQDAIKNAKFME